MSAVKIAVKSPAIRLIFDNKKLLTVNHAQTSTSVLALFSLLGLLVPLARLGIIMIISGTPFPLKLLFLQVLLASVSIVSVAASLPVSVSVSG